MLYNTRVILRFLDLEDPDEAESRRGNAVELVLADLKEGVDLGGPPRPVREEIYDERMRELEKRRERRSKVGE